MTAQVRQGKFGLTGHIVRGIGVLVLRGVVVIALAAMLAVTRLVYPTWARLRSERAKTHPAQPA